VEAQGFKRSVREGVVITAGATTRLDVALELGSVSESVEIQAKTTPLETESTRVGTNVTTKLVEDLPLVVGGQIRNVFNLALIAPETRTANSYRIGGGQGAGWDMLMDGVSLASASTNYQTERAPISSVPVDAIREFTVETSGMKAEYGRAMGFISFETKSGTNQFHGNLFEFLRNDAFDARGFFAARTPISKQHDFGGTIGGPIKIPKLYDGTNRTFFFASYEGFRYREGNRPSFNTIPLMEMYQGDFRGWTNAQNQMIPIYDPATTRPRAGGGFERDAFSNNMIPRSRFSTVANNYLSVRPPEMAPNIPGHGITISATPAPSLIHGTSTACGSIITSTPITAFQACYSTVLKRTSLPTTILRAFPCRSTARVCGRARTLRAALPGIVQCRRAS
jgi:hypothetical protein